MMELLMAQGKWISDLSSTTPVTDAARHVLTVRLGVIGDYLARAIQEPDKDPEHVHQLRVGTRRAGAALKIFALCLPNKVRKGAKKRIRKIRRAAGAARDWDVFLMGLAAWREQKNDNYQAGCDFLIGLGEGCRHVAQAQLQKSVVEYPFDFDRFLAETVAAVRKPQEEVVPTLGDLASPILRDLLKQLAEAAERDLDDFQHLHRVRVLGKRLRYAMEVFVDCFAPLFREELYPAVEEMQEILGLANDSHVAANRLEAIRSRLRTTRPADWKRFRTGVDGLLRHHRQKLPKERKRFLKWWEGWQKWNMDTLLTEWRLPTFRENNT
jgi:CHAD domain-containing protein